LARNTKAEAVYLVAPGLVATPEMRDALIQEPSIAAVFEAYEDLTVALVGVGSLEPSNLLRASGNAIADETEARLRELGAIGDVCMRFYDAEGNHLASEMDERVLGISAGTLRRVPRRIGVAGGKRKWPSIRAALTGGWVNVLVTDQATAAELANAPG
jgi:DNA-binding transcriptional regulator LsrR (DeoR family)